MNVDAVCTDTAGTVHHVVDMQPPPVVVSVATAPEWGHPGGCEMRPSSDRRVMANPLLPEEEEEGERCSAGSRSLDGAGVTTVPPSAMRKKPTAVKPLSQQAGIPRDFGVTQGFRAFMSDEEKEERRQYFLQQQCDVQMSWVRVCGAAPLATATFEEVAANSLRASHMLRRASWTASGTREITPGRRHALRSDGDNPADTLADDSDRWGRGGAESAAEHSNESSRSRDGSAVWVSPPARFGHTAVLYKDSFVLVFGGKANDGRYFNDVYQYDIAARQWSCLQDDGSVTDAAVAPPTNESPQVSSRFSNGSSPTVTTVPRSTATQLIPAVSSSSAPPSADTAAASPFSQSSTGGPDARQQQPGRRNNEGARGAAVLHGVAAPSPSSGDEGGRATAAAPLYGPSLPVENSVRPRRPAGRVGHAAVLYGDSMFVLSGEQQGHYLDDMWSLNVGRLTWCKEGGLPFSPRKGHTMHLLPADCTATRARDDMLVVFGGLVRISRLRPRVADPELPPRQVGGPDTDFAPTNEVLLYYPAQRRWCRLKTCGDVPPPRFYHVSQLVTGTTLLLVFGGRTVTPQESLTDTPEVVHGTFLNDLHLLDVSTGLWRHLRNVTGDIPSPRMCSASVFVNGTFGVLAGGGDTYCDAAFEFSLQHQRWRRLKPNNQPACSRPTVTYAKDRLILFGGFAPHEGVMNCTMELSLSPLSLKNQYLLWWNRCVFEKFVRTKMRSRSTELAENTAAAAAAAAAAMEQGSPCRNYGCGGQEMLSRSPGSTAYSSPTRTPQISRRGWVRGSGRPAPLSSPNLDQGETWRGHREAAVRASGRATSSRYGNASPPPPLLNATTPPYSPSSPLAYSPLLNQSQSAAWYEDPYRTSSFSAAVGPAGVAAAAATAYGSPIFGGVSSPRIFPSYFGAVLSTSFAGSQAGSPGPVSVTSYGSQPHLRPRVNAALAQGMAPYNNLYSSLRGTNNSIGVGGAVSSYPAHAGPTAAVAVEATASAGTVAGGLFWGTDSGNRGNSACSTATSVSQSAASSFFCAALPPVPTATTGSSGRNHRRGPTGPSGIPPMSSLSFIGSYAGGGSACIPSSPPRFAGRGLSSAPHTVSAGAAGTEGESNVFYRNICAATAGGAAAASEWSLPSQIQSPASPLLQRSMRVDVAVRGLTPPPSSAHDAGNAPGYWFSASLAQHANSIENDVVLISPAQHPLFHRGSAQPSEPGSSRASSAHSTCSASLGSANQQQHHAHTKRTLQRLEGANGPYLLRALTASLAKNNPAVVEMRW